MTETEKLKDTIVEAILEKKGHNVVVLDLSELDGAITSAFVICDAPSTMQVSAITDGVQEKVKKELGENAWRVDGQNNSLWVAIDYIDVVVHVFQTELRDFYKLEKLWADAPIKRYEE